MVDAAVEVARLSPGEDVQVELRVAPQEGRERFRARFAVQYSDPLEAHGEVVFAEVVTLLPLEGPLQPFANPYIDGEHRWKRDRRCL